MGLSNYPYGFPGGITIRGLPVLNSYAGKVFWVGNNTPGIAASNIKAGGQWGESPQKPFATLDYAVGRCLANRGDIIMVMPGHAESISAAGALALDVAGITIVCMGTGSLRPTFTFDTVITADMDIDAANITIIGGIFVNGIDNLTVPIDINAADFSMLGVETRDNNVNYHCDNFIVTDDNANRLTIEGWIHRANGGKTGAQTAISIIGGDDHLVIPYMIDGDFATACIENVTTACDNLRIMGSMNHPCYLRVRNVADVLIACVATTKGHIGPNIIGRLNDNAANITEALVGDDMEFYQPIELVNSDGESSMQTNITASTDA